MILILGFGVSSFAQNAKNESPKGRIINDGAIVYTQSNFDSPVANYLKVGQVLPMSTKLFDGAFYKVLYAKGKMGYVADNDIQPLWKKATSGSGNKKKTVVTKQSEEKPRKKRPMSLTQFVGVSFLQMDYKEETMGRELSEGRTFFGAKLTGPDLVISGMTVTEVNFLFSQGAPSYYQKYTGRSATGLIFIGDFLFETVFPQGPNSVFFIGFGPMFRYSKFNLQLVNGATATPYSAEDMALGAVFNTGAAVRLGNVALRAEARYNWEKQRYFGYGLSVQMAF